MWFSRWWTFKEKSFYFPSLGTENSIFLSKNHALITDGKLVLVMTTKPIFSASTIIWYLLGQCLSIKQKELTFELGLWWCQISFPSIICLPRHTRFFCSQSIGEAPFRTLLSDADGEILKKKGSEEQQRPFRLRLQKRRCCSAQPSSYRATRRRDME